MKYVAFIIALLVGGIMVIKSEKFVDYFGRNDWADRTFGLYGGSRLFYKMLGILIILLSSMMITGWLEDLIKAIFTPISG